MSNGVPECDAQRVRFPAIEGRLRAGVFGRPPETFYVVGWAIRDHNENVWRFVENNEASSFSTAGEAWAAL